MQAQEEYQHAMKFYDFIYDVDGSVELKAIPQPEGNYESVLAVFKEALAHEELVTSKINKIMDIAVEENNRFTINFLQWFIEEQLEEENSMKKNHKHFGKNRWKLPRNVYVRQRIRSKSARTHRINQKDRFFSPVFFLWIN